MFAGPIIAGEVLTAPRPLRFYVARASYVGLLFVLMWTAWQSLIGWREVGEVGLIARFGGILFALFVLVQLSPDALLRPAGRGHGGGPREGPADVRPAADDRPERRGDRPGQARRPACSRSPRCC